MPKEEMKLKETTFENTKLSLVPLNWKEVWDTNCPLLSASNVDQELGWAREDTRRSASVRLSSALPARTTSMPTTSTTSTTSFASAGCFRQSR